MAQAFTPPYLTSGARSSSRVLVYRNNKYLKNKKRGPTIYWRCHRDDCRISLVTFDFDETAAHPNIRIKKQPEVHNHPDDTDTVNREQFRSEAHRFVAEDQARTVGAS